MSGICYIDCAEAEAGRIKKRRSIHPLGVYIVERGGTASSNEFVDPHLKLGVDHVENVVLIIRSARNQGHTGLRIRLTPESFEAISSRLLEVSALEWLDVETEAAETYQDT